MSLFSISGPVPTRRLLLWTSVVVVSVFSLVLLLGVFKAGDSWLAAVSVASLAALGCGGVMAFLFLVLNVVASNREQDARVRVFQATHRRFLLMFLATFATISLMITTWAMVRVSAWIVFHDAVGIQMNQEGHGLEDALAEAFFFGYGGWLLIPEAICGIVFLGLLWHTLYRLEKKAGDEAT